MDGWVGGQRSAASKGSKNARPSACPAPAPACPAPARPPPPPPAARCGALFGHPFWGHGGGEALCGLLDVRPRSQKRETPFRLRFEGLQVQRSDRIRLCKPRNGRLTPKSTESASGSLETGV